MYMLSPLPPDHTVKNKDAFIVLQDVFIASQSSHLGEQYSDTLADLWLALPVSLHHLINCGCIE